MSSLPIRLYPWITSEMTNLRESPEYLRKDFVEKELKRKPPFSTLLSLSITSIAVPLINSLHCIPVYKNPFKLKYTFEKSIELLKNNNFILLFPEDTLKPPVNGKINPADPDYVMYPFKTGFVRLGKLYYIETGKRLEFYPLSFNKSAGILAIGRSVFYNPENSIRYEEKRIANYLETEIQNLHKYFSKIYLEGIEKPRLIKKIK